VAGTLPASRLTVRTREPTGADELFVLECADSPQRAMCKLARRLIADAEGEPLVWADLPAVDLAAAALLIRSVWIGGTIRAEARCPADDCGGESDIAFTVDAYLDHRRPRAYRGASEDDDWYQLSGAGVRFRVPTVADLEASAGAVAAAVALASSCIRPAAPDAATLRRVERALQAIAPPLDGVVAGACPLCGANVQLWFSPIEFVLDELAGVSSGLFDDVHELARAYHWGEDEILRLERRRRRGYVELIRAELVA